MHEQGVDESRYHTFYAISLAKSALKNIQDAGEESEYQLNENSNENCKSSDAMGMLGNKIEGMGLISCW